MNLEINNLYHEDGGVMDITEKITKIEWTLTVRHEYGSAMRRRMAS